MHGGSDNVQVRMISNQKINKIFQIIQKVSNPDAIYLFGSYARGEPGGNSDLDIAIIKERIIDRHKELLAIRKSLFKVWVPMDLILMKKSEFDKKKEMSGTVQHEINKHGVMLYGQRQFKPSRMAKIR